jgi:hypothetical protein
MTRPPQWILAPATGLAVIVTVLAVTAEKTEQEVTTSAALVAYTNPTLAAARFFEEMGVATQTVESLETLPPTDHVLVIATTDRVRLRRQEQDLVGWVHAGGHLLLELGAWRSESEGLDLGDSLLQAFGLWAWDYHVHPEVSALELEVPGSDPFEIRMNGSRCISYEPSDSVWESAVGEGHDCPSAIQINPGQGSLSVFADLDWIRNEHIGDLDHAVALWAIVRTQGRPAGVWILNHDEPVGLTGLVWDHAWTLVVSGCVLLLAWIWSAGQRFGPRLPPLSPDRHERLAHVQAVGELMWRHRRQDILVDAVRRAVRRAVPDSANLSPEELAKRISADPDALRAALTHKISRDPNGFIQTIQLLEGLRRAK